MLVEDRDLTSVLPTKKLVREGAYTEKRSRSSTILKDAGGTAYPILANNRKRQFTMFPHAQPRPHPRPRRKRYHIQSCRWCCLRCRVGSQERFRRRLLAAGVPPREFQCWRCTARLSRHPDWAGVPLIPVADRARLLADTIPGVVVASDLDDTPPPVCGSLVGE